MARRRVQDDWDDDTVPCPYCRRAIHEDSQRCPYCEQYISQEDAPSRKPWWLIITVVVCILIIALWLLR